MIKKYEEFINELRFNKIDDSGNVRNIEGRREDTPYGDHSFTDALGKRHPHGFKVEGLEIRSSYYLAKFLVDKIMAKQFQLPTIDMTMVDMSDVKTINKLFYYIFDILRDDIKMDNSQIKDLKFDTSGWDLSSCVDFDECVKDVTTDIGLETWKLSEKNIKKFDIISIKNSYYESNPPSWFVFNIKSWVKSCLNKYDGITKQEYGVDKERSKELGKKCYWVKFNADYLTFTDIPDNITILDFHKFGRPNLYCKELTTLKNIPKKVISNTRATLTLDLKNITDDKIELPSYVKTIKLWPGGDITKLPKNLDCSINISDEKHLGYLERVEGDFIGHGTFNLQNDMTGVPKYVGGNFHITSSNIKSFKGIPEYVGGDLVICYNESVDSLDYCPKYVGGNLDLYNSSITHIGNFPEYVRGNINLSGCDNLKNLIGLPETIEGSLDIGYNDLESLDGLPEEIGGKLIISRLKVQGKEVTIDDILKVSPNLEKTKIKSIVY